ncbi:MAG: AAA family ATPase, partial [Pseudomonadales bacterium]|nr:AAA family ATPase [Pseudomonadales bacterium]
MYNDYFSFHRTPFSIAPDPDFLYLSGKHREALAHLVYGLQTDGGFVLLTGEVGTGKTTLLRSLLSQIPDNLDVAFILNPKLTVKELLETLCEELGVPVNTHEVLGVKQFIDRLNRQLLKTHALGRSTVLIIDEAQNLSPEVLEQIRLLTNLETNEKKLLRIILIGQPELSEILYRDDLRQLAQRITARYHLSALSSEDTYEYIYHRLKKSGGSPNTFSKRAIRRVHKLSKGIPRLINIIADRALLGAYVESSHQVTAQIVNTAAKEIRSPSPYSVSKSITAAALLGILIALWYIQLPTNHLMPFQPTQHTAKGTLGIEPSAVLNKEPSAVLGKEPSAALNK